MNKNRTLKNVCQQKTFISSMYILKHIVIHAIFSILVLCMISQAAALLQVIRGDDVVIFIGSPKLLELLLL